MLLDAITRGRLYQVKFLLESGSVNVNVTDHNGQTPMMKAILLGDKMHHTRYKIVRLLLDHGAKVNTADKDGKTALMLAVIHGQKDVTERILKCSVIDIDLNAGDYDGNTALIHAASRGYELITSLLITSLKRFGLGVDNKNRRGFTAMLEAVRYGHGLCAQVLMVEGSASLTIRDPENFMNAEEWAVQNQLHDLVTLIEKTKKQPTPSNSQQNPTSMDSATPETNNLVINLVDKCEDGSKPESPHDVTKRPSSRKARRRSSLSVPKIMHNLTKTNQEYSLPMEVTHTVDSSPKELSKDNKACSVTGAPTMNENEAKESRYLSPRSETSLLLTNRKSPRPRLSNASLTRCSSAKHEVQQLLNLYGVQTSMYYRKGYDITTLPPSGMWPDPTASLSGSVENLNAFDRESDFFGDSSFRLHSRRSVLSEASTRRTSVVGNTRESRRTSIISQGNSPSSERRTSVMGRKCSITQPPPRNMFEACGRKPGERKMSMAPRPTMERPVIRKMHSTINGLLV